VRARNEKKREEEEKGFGKEDGRGKRREEHRERERERERNWIVRGALPRFVSDFIIMRTRAAVQRVNRKNGITSNHWPSLPRTKPQGKRQIYIYI